MNGDRALCAKTEMWASDTLSTIRSECSSSASEQEARVFHPNRAYDTYHSLPKAFGEVADNQLLVELGENMQDEQLPNYLDAAAWSFAEAGMMSDESAAERMRMLEKAEDCWIKALREQERINQTDRMDWLREDTASYRIALNLACLPVMKAVVAGNVTPLTRSRTIDDILSIAQTSALQTRLAAKANDINSLGEHIGFQYECNAILSVMMLDGYNRIALPSSARAGAGYDYPEHTHDVMVVLHHWGDIRRITPVEVKSASTQRDLKRYQALIVRGKMHLSVPGKFPPEHTTNAFANIHHGVGTGADQEITKHAAETMRDLLFHYHQGGSLAKAGKMTFRDRSKLAEIRPEYRTTH